MGDVQGTCDDRFSTVKDAFAANLDSGLDVGASVAVSLDGELVVDLWGGTVDADGTAPWERDTVTNVWSTTKTMTALTALLLADRGELDVDAPVARYWPEFAANGKDGVLVRHLLSHTAGLPGWSEPMQPADLYDWEKATGVLARQAPWWSPGTAIGYHAVTQGYLVGEVVRRVAGRTVGEVFRDEIAAPLGADFHIGAPASVDDRYANVIPPPPLGLDGVDPEGVAVRALTNPLLDAAQSWEVPWRRAEIPAAGGTGNARSVATVQQVVACGGTVGGTTILSEAGCERIYREQADDVDLVLGVKVRHGIGYGLTSPDLPVSPNDKACFWGGWGGSLVVIDPELRLCVAYVMNRMGEGTVGDARGASLVLAAYGSLST
jgi:CubicO group peptidase (beta-lactamase class C family)